MERGAFILLRGYGVAFFLAVGVIFGHPAVGFVIGLLVLFLVSNPERLTGKVFDKVSEDPIRWGFIVFGTSMVLGGILYSFIEPGNIIDGMWWVYVSATTTGYGDYAPHTPEGRFLAVFVIAMGVACVSLFQAALTGRVAEIRMIKRAAQASKTQTMTDDFDGAIHRITEELETLRATYQATHEGGITERTHA
jgi:hypothetical protein